MDLPHISEDPDFRACIEACDKILAAKGHDYTQGDAKSADPLLRLKNFIRNGERLDLPPEKILAVYLFKHIDAIETFLRMGDVASEPIETRLYDGINYLLLLYKLVKWKKAQAYITGQAYAVGPRPASALDTPR